MDVGARVELRSVRLAGWGCGGDRGRSQIFAQIFPSVGPGFHVSSRGFQKVLVCICDLVATACCSVVAEPAQPLDAPRQFTGGIDR